VSEQHTSGAPTGVTAVFVAGFLMETYGLFFVLASGAALAGMLWIGAGLLLQVAGGAFRHPGPRGTRLANPLRVLHEAIRVIRTRIRSWDERR
jgi:hypothetical protein